MVGDGLFDPERERERERERGLLLASLADLEGHPQVEEHVENQHHHDIAVLAWDIQGDRHTLLSLLLLLLPLSLSLTLSSQLFKDLTKRRIGCLPPISTQPLYTMTKAFV